MNHNDNEYKLKAELENLKAELANAKSATAKAVAALALEERLKKEALYQAELEAERANLAEAEIKKLKAALEKMQDMLGAAHDAALEVKEERD